MGVDFEVVDEEMGNVDFNGFCLVRLDDVE